MKFCIDPGHGQSNRKPGVYDPGAMVRADGALSTEAAIVMDWADELRSILQAMGHHVVRTRKDALDPAPVIERANIAAQYQCEVMVSLHCNAADGKANGTETFYRGAANRSLAKACNDAVVTALGTRDRGVKTESESRHSKLAVLNFRRAVLIEIGFIDHISDREAMLDPDKRRAACEALAEVLTA